MKITEIFKTTEQNRPWSDIRLPENAINYLWDIINHSPTRTDVKRERDSKDLTTLADFKNDKDNWFFENVLKKECTENTIYKFESPPTFVLTSMWVNHQKQYEFIPPHVHEAFYSFVVFMKIPTHWKEQHALPFCKTVPNSAVTSNFQFIFEGVTGMPGTYNIELCSEDEGRMLIFPAWLMHQVFPFYGTKEERITISGNINLENYEKIE